MSEDEVRSLLATMLTILEVSAKDVRRLKPSSVFHILSRSVDTFT